jgi:LPXTG-site transpeptidase (sortase) family protein
MVIFAHAREGLFLNLQHILQGEEVYVLTNKKWYAYTVDEITQVTPEQVEVIAPTTDERITLFTCSGFADEKRLIVVGKKKEVTFGLDETFTNLLE